MKILRGWVGKIFFFQGWDLYIRNKVCVIYVVKGGWDLL